MRNAHLNDNADLVYAENVRHERQQVSALQPLFKKEPTAREQAELLVAKITLLRAEFNRAWKEAEDYKGDDEIHRSTLRIAKNDALDLLCGEQSKLDAIMRGIQ